MDLACNEKLQYIKRLYEWCIDQCNSTDKKIIHVVVYHKYKKHSPITYNELVVELSGWWHTTTIPADIKNEFVEFNDYARYLWELGVLVVGR
jgi:hypothetical protein